MERFEEIVWWVVGGLFSAAAAVGGYLYTSLVKRVANVEKKLETTDNRVDSQEVIDIEIKGDMKRLEEKLSGDMKRLEEKLSGDVRRLDASAEANHRELLLRLDHIKENTERR